MTESRESKHIFFMASPGKSGWSESYANKTILKLHKAFNETMHQKPVTIKVERANIPESLLYMDNSPESFMSLFRIDDSVRDAILNHVLHHLPHAYDQDEALSIFEYVTEGGDVDDLIDDASYTNFTILDNVYLFTEFEPDQDKAERNDAVIKAVAESMVNFYTNDQLAHIVSYLCESADMGSGLTLSEICLGIWDTIDEMNGLLEDRIQGIYVYSEDDEKWLFPNSWLDEFGERLEPKLPSTEKRQPRSGGAPKP